MSQESIILSVPPEFSDMRADRFLSEKLPELSRSRIQQLISDGSITVNGKAIKSSLKLTGGESVEVHIPEAAGTEILPENIPLDILYEDEDILIVNKPKGMTVHPAPGHPGGTLVNAVMHHCGDSLAGINGEVRPGIVHRLDKDTSGLIIVAKDDKTHELLSKMIKNREVDRRYLALVWGVVSHDKGRIEAPIGRDINDRQKYIVTDLNGKDSITNFSVIERFKEATLIECKLETGRTHQIRVHMNYIGHPIVNDPVYGKRKIINSFGQMLHSYSLKFTHPITKEDLSFKQDPPKEFTEVLDMFREFKN